MGESTKQTHETKRNETKWFVSLLLVSEAQEALRSSVKWERTEQGTCPRPVRASGGGTLYKSWFEKFYFIGEKYETSRTALAFGEVQTTARQGAKGKQEFGRDGKLQWQTSQIVRLAGELGRIGNVFPGLTVSVNSPRPRMGYMQSALTSWKSVQSGHVSLWSSPPVERKRGHIYGTLKMEIWIEMKC